MYLTKTQISMNEYERQPNLPGFFKKEYLFITCRINSLYFRIDDHSREGS